MGMSLKIAELWALVLTESSGQEGVPGAEMDLG